VAATLQRLPEKGLRKNGEPGTRPAPALVTYRRPGSSRPHFPPEGITRARTLQQHRPAVAAPGQGALVSVVQGLRGCAHPRSGFLDSARVAKAGPVGCRAGCHQRQEGVGADAAVEPPDQVQAWHPAVAGPHPGLQAQRRQFPGSAPFCVRFEPSRSPRDSASPGSGGASDVEEKCAPRALQAWLEPAMVDPSSRLCRLQQGFEIVAGIGVRRASNQQVGSRRQSAATGQALASAPLARRSPPSTKGHRHQSQRNRAMFLRASS